VDKSRRYPNVSKVHHLSNCCVIVPVLCHEIQLKRLYASNNNYNALEGQTNIHISRLVSN
jgi:hypothetical protein